MHAVPGRDEALRSAVIAWASDVEAGHDTGLYAWRRANVAELNALARRWMADSGRLSGPELATPDGASYRAGDHVVALAPSRDGALVTSQRATVEAVDLSQNTLALRTADGRHVNLSAEDAGADRLGHAYATTVHRSQGATTTRAHLFADGGGRELAYVAMSRAREGTQVWTVADDLAQAREDLAREWSSERRPTWAIDIGLPGAGQLDRTALATLPVGDRVHAIAVVGAQARLSADAMRAALPADPSPKLDAATDTLTRLRRERADLESGTGVHGQTAVGQALKGLRDALAELRSAEQAAQGSSSWRGRRTARRSLPLLAEAAGHAQRRWDDLVAPELARLDGEVASAEAEVGQLAAARQRYRAGAGEPARRWLHAQRSAGALASGLDAYRDQLDGWARPARSPTAAPAAKAPPLPSPAYGPATAADLGASL